MHDGRSVSAGPENSNEPIPSLDRRGIGDGCRGAGITLDEIRVAQRPAEVEYLIPFRWPGKDPDRPLAALGTFGFVATLFAEERPWGPGLRVDPVTVDRWIPDVFDVDPAANAWAVGRVDQTLLRTLVRWVDDRGWQRVAEFPGRDAPVQKMVAAAGDSVCALQFKHLFRWDGTRFATDVLLGPGNFAGLDPAMAPHPDGGLYLLDLGEFRHVARDGSSVLLGRLEPRSFHEPTLCFEHIAPVTGGCWIADSVCQIHFWDGTRLTKRGTTERRLAGLWGPDATTLWAVHSGRGLSRFDGTTWSSVWETHSGSLSVLGTDATHVFVLETGATGSALHRFDGRSMTALWTSPYTSNPTPPWLVASEGLRGGGGTVWSASVSFDRLRAKDAVTR